MDMMEQLVNETKENKLPGTRLFQQLGSRGSWPKEDESFFGWSNKDNSNSSGRIRRRASCSINQLAEVMITDAADDDDDVRRMDSKFNVKDHATLLKQQTMNEQNSLSPFSTNNNNNDNIRHAKDADLKLIVEDGKTKLRRHRIAKQRMQQQQQKNLEQKDTIVSKQQQKQEVGQQLQQQRKFEEHYETIEQPHHKQFSGHRPPTNSRFHMLKSPIFATNTLDEDDLNRLAGTEPTTKLNTHMEMGRLLPVIGQDENGRDKVVEVVKSMKQQQQQQQPEQHLNSTNHNMMCLVNDCGCGQCTNSLSTNMNINRQQQQQIYPTNCPPNKHFNSNTRSNSSKLVELDDGKIFSGCCVIDGDKVAVDFESHGYNWPPAEVEDAYITENENAPPSSSQLSSSSDTDGLLHWSGSADEEDDDCGDEDSSSQSPACAASCGCGSGSKGVRPVTCRLKSSVDQILKSADVGGGTGTTCRKFSADESICSSSVEPNGCSRGGPTPTNDLIRALIHRDRMALLSTTTPPTSGGQAASLGEPANIEVVENLANTSTYSSGPRGSLGSNVSNHHYYQQANKQTTTTTTTLAKPIRLEAANLSNGKSPLPQTHNISYNDTITTTANTTAASDSISSSSSGSGGSPLVRLPIHSNNSSNLNSAIKTANKPKQEEQKEERRGSFKLGQQGNQKQHQQTTLEPPEKSKGFDLSGLIGKCQRLQLSSSSNSSSRKPSPTVASLVPHQPALRTLRSASPRRPSEAPQILPAGSSGASASSDPAQRRHSTYMFPLLLNQTPASDDDDDDDDDDDCGGEEEDTSEDGSRGQVVVCVDGLESELADGTREFGAQHVTAENINNNNNTTDGNGSNSKISRNNSKLRNSTSSPSALSTPTNELGRGGGCGGPCCMSGVNAISKQQLPQAEIGGQVSHRMQQQQQFQGGALSQQQGKETLRKLSAENPIQRKLFILGGEHISTCTGEQAHGLRRRNRVGSGPLERLKLAASCGQQQQQQQAMDVNANNKQAGNYQGKRHSLISLALSGVHHQVGGNHLVSRLSHPRSLFTSHSNNTNNNINNNNQLPYHRQQRRSVECAMPMEQHYDPLIPETGFKIVVMGASGSGKTSIIQRFIYNSFSWRHNPTVEDTYFIEFPYMKNTINISISDTSGTYQFPAMRRLAINSGDAFILVYSVDNPESLNDLEQLRQNILDEREQAYSEVSASIISNDSTSSGLASSQTSVSNGPQTSASHQLQHHHQQQQPFQSHFNNHHLHLQEPCRDPSPARHWSLASIFNSSHNQGHNHNQQQQQQQQHLNHLHQEQLNRMHPNNQGGFINHSSLNSSINSSFSCSSSADNSRRSSVSAAEAALKTRRTRHPPMVIVGNKQDLPDDQHLVNSDEIEARAVIDWNNGFVRASAALNLNIDEIFQQVLRQAKQPPTLTEAIVSKRRKSLPPKLPH